MGAGWSPPPIQPERGGLWLYLALPYRRCQFDTHLTPEQCTQALRAIVEPRRWLRSPFKRSATVFEGAVTSGKFLIRRITFRRSSFLPEVTGLIHNDANGTHVSLTMRLNWFALVTWTVWIVGGLATFAYLLIAYTRPQRDQALKVIALALILGYLASGFFFGIEAGKARRILTEVLTGTRTPTPP
jgi:hypothetical protein